MTLPLTITPLPPPLFSSCLYLADSLGSLSIRTDLTLGPTVPLMVKGMRSGLTPRPKSSSKDLRVMTSHSGSSLGSSLGGTGLGETGKDGSGAFSQITSPDAFMRYGFTLEAALVSGWD